MEVAKQLLKYERQCAKYDFLVAMRAGETPVHIPNTMVKTCTAENTLLETAWKDRWLPDFLKKAKHCF